MPKRLWSLFWVLALASPWPANGQDATTEPAVAAQEAAPDEKATSDDGDPAPGDATAPDDDASELAADIAAIEAAIQSYVAAFNAKDVNKLVSHWSPDGVYVSRSTGDRLVGHDAMTEEFTAILSGDEVPKLAVATESIEFISPNVALERGSATVTRSEQIEETTYQVVYVKRDGAWLVDRVSEDEKVTPVSNYKHLKELEWLVGDWVDDNEGIAIDIECRWTEKQNYLSRKYAVTSLEGVESSGLQIVGWDAKQKQIRSWLFDSDGGFVSGTWNKRDDRWVVTSVATLPDGSSGSFTSIFRPTDEGDYVWKKINRVLDGNLLPNVEEVVVRRR